MAAVMQPPVSDMLRYQAANAQGIKAVQAGTPGKAIAFYEEALTILRSPEVLDNLGDALARSGRLEEARAAFEESVELRADNPNAWYNLAVTLEQFMDFEGARSAYRNALACRVMPQALNNLANVEHWLVHLPEAERLYRSAIKHGYGDAIWNLSLTLLMQGKYAEGWDWYTFRPQMRDMRERSKLWRGDSVHGKRLLIVTEQGLGDSVFAMRYLPLLRRQGASLIVACDPGLKRLMQAMLEDDEPGLPPCMVLEKGPSGSLSVDQSAFDYECLMMSLPGYLSPDGTGPNGRYLKALGVAMPKTLNVGLCWNGSTALGMPAERNIPLAALKPLSEIPGVRFVSLQKGDGVDEIAGCGFEVHDAMAGAHDVYDTACVIESLDLVITIDTLIPHLAGALGKPTWLLNRFSSCWQWGTPAFDPKLYASITQFRQAKRGDWAPVVEQVTAALRSLAESRA